MNIEYGTIIRLRHLRTTQLLKSLDRKFPEPSISKQQMVVATDQESDPETHWLVKERHGSDGRRGEPVRNGDTIRLQHLGTGAHLHSLSIKARHQAPITRDGAQQEVSASAPDKGNDHDDWVLETYGTEFWQPHEKVRIYHAVTKWPLHSHRAYDKERTAGFQEVTAYANKDDNDLWCALPVAPKRVAAAAKPASRNADAGDTEGKPGGFVEHVRNHPLAYVVGTIVATAAGTWQVCKATLIERAERDQAYAERQLATERAAHEQTQAKLRKVETDLENLTQIPASDKPRAEALSSIAAENSELRKEVAQLRTQVSEDRAREWPAFTEDQIQAWAEHLGGFQIKSITVFWGQNVDAKYLYRSIQKLGAALKVEVLPGGGNGLRHQIIVHASVQDQAAIAWVKLLKEAKYPTVLQASDGVPAGEISVFIGERP
jgi:hypothetical protein